MSDARGWQNNCTGSEALLGAILESDFRPGGTRVEPVFMGNEGHRLIIGPTGSGKFWTAICPMLLTVDRSSAIVFDVAGGEAAQWTGEHRADLGPVLTLDPYRLQSDGSGALNPLDFLGDDDGGMLGRARALADAIMIFKKTGGESDYFNGQARDLLAALLIHVRTWPDETDRTLNRVRQLIRGPLVDNEEKGYRGMGLADMARNTACDNFVRDAALNIDEDQEFTGGRNTFYVRQTLRENTSFLDTPEIQRVLAKTTMDLRALRDGVATLYVISPAAELRQLGRWMRLVYATILPIMQWPVDATRHAGSAGTPLHIIMDEFAAFGRFERVKDDMATVRKFGIQYHIAAQKISQLQGEYGRAEWENFVPRYLQVLGSDEQATAEYVSKRLGTVDRQRRSTSTQRGGMGNSNSSESHSEHTVPFKQPHDINGMLATRCYVAIQGSIKPLYLYKIPAHEDPALNVLLSGPNRQRINYLGQSRLTRF